MTESSVMPETTPDVAEIASFLRRFADLLGNGHNATYLHRASELLESLTVRVTAASDEEQLWRYKYETLTRHTDELEAECDALRNDIEGHLDITSAVLAERALMATLQGGCTAPVAALGRADGGQLTLIGRVGSLDGVRLLEAQDTASSAESQTLGRRVAESLLAQGAGQWIR